MSHFNRKMTKNQCVYNNRVSIAGVAIDNVNMVEAIDRIEQFIHEKQVRYVVTPNVDHIVKLQKDIEFKAVYKDASLVLPDGQPLIWAANFLGAPLKEKVSGSDLFPRLCERASQKGYKLFFLGGRPMAGERSAQILAKKYNAIKIVGVYSPPFGFERNCEENEKILRLINQAKPDILFVGLGAPKQEKWVHHHRDRLSVPVSIGVGVTFEFTAGMVRRAPLWMQSYGLEWFWRLMMEPKKLWKRYLIDDISFLGLIVKQKLGHSFKE